MQPAYGLTAGGGKRYNSPMCGIAGSYNTDGAAGGPGGAGRHGGGHSPPRAGRRRVLHATGRVGLAHLALRIIDLSDAALQPMANEDGRLRLVFNGEIYNYLELRPGLEAARAALPFAIRQRDHPARL